MTKSSNFVENQSISIPCTEFVKEWVTNSPNNCLNLQISPIQLNSIVSSYFAKTFNSKNLKIVTCLIKAMINTSKNDKEKKSH